MTTDTFLTKRKNPQYTNDQEVTLKFDKTKRDRYGRSLALVYVGENMLNEMLIKEGLARFLPNYRYSKEIKQLFIDAENSAKKNKKGIYSNDPKITTRRYFTLP